MTPDNAPEQGATPDVDAALAYANTALKMAARFGERKGSTIEVNLMRSVVHMSEELARLRTSNKALADALNHCLLEHGGYTIRGESERIARAALTQHGGER